MLTKNLISIFLSLFSGVVISLLLNNYSPLISQSFYHSLLYMTLLFLTLNVMNTLGAKSDKFTQLLLGGIVIKLLLTFSFAFIYSFYCPAGFFNFAMHFICHYVLFTVFEIRYLTQLFKTIVIDYEK